MRRLRRPQSLAVLAAYKRQPVLPSEVRILGLDPGSLRTGYAVVETLGGRISDARKVIEKQRVIIARERQQTGSLKDAKSYLKSEIEYREQVISALRDTVREREAELIALGVEPDAQVHHMPRRVLADHDFVWEPLSDDDELNGELRPTVVDIKIIDMVLPNYEADRQPA